MTFSEIYEKISQITNYSRERDSSHDWTQLRPFYHLYEMLTVKCKLKETNCWNISWNTNAIIECIACSCSNIQIPVDSRRGVLSLEQIEELRPKNTGLAGFNYKSFYRTLIQLGKIFRLRYSRHVIQGKLEAEFFELLKKLSSVMHAQYR